MKRLSAACLLLVFSVLLVSCGSQSRSNPGVNVTGNWNVDLTETGQTVPSYSFGLGLTKDTTIINGTEIPYTGGTQANTGCVNYGGLTASGNTNGGSLVTMIVNDPTTHSTFTLSGTADSAVSQINGTFTANFGANGSTPACPSTSGTVLFTKQ